MAIINCPVCNERISSVAETCKFCHTTFSEDISEEEIYRSARNARFLKIQRLQNLSFVFIVLFTAGALLMYLGISDQNETYNTTGRVMIALGFVGYVVARVSLVIFKRK